MQYQENYVRVHNAHVPIANSGDLLLNQLKLAWVVKAAKLHPTRAGSNFYVFSNLQAIERKRTSNWKVI